MREGIGLGKKERILILISFLFLKLLFLIFPLLFFKRKKDTPQIPGYLTSSHAHPLMNLNQKTYSPSIPSSPPQSLLPCHYPPLLSFSPPSPPRPLQNLPLFSPPKPHPSSQSMHQHVHAASGEITCGAQFVNIGCELLCCEREV